MGIINKFKVFRHSAISEKIKMNKNIKFIQWRNNKTSRFFDILVDLGLWGGFYHVS